MCEEDESPTSVMEAGGDDQERISLPKSISVRSNSYSKRNQEQAASASLTRAITRLRTPSPLNTAVITNYSL
jgi:butyrate response factor 1